MARKREREKRPKPIEPLPGQPSLFEQAIETAPNPELGAALKDEGMERVEAHTDEEYKRKFWRWVDDLEAGVRFQAEDVTAAVGLRARGGSRANNVVGALINGLARQGYIVKAGHVLSKRARSHGAEVVLWERTQKGKRSWS